MPEFDISQAKKSLQLYTIAKIKKFYVFILNFIPLCDAHFTGQRVDLTDCPLIKNSQSASVI